MNCPGCDIETTDDAKFCAECGFPLANVEVKECINCNTKMLPAAQFCHECGGLAETPDYQRILGVKITDEDIADLMFGHMTKTINLGKVKVKIQTLNNGDRKEILLEADIEMNRLLKKHDVNISDKTYMRILDDIELSKILLEVNDTSSPAVEKLKWVQGLPEQVAYITLRRARSLSEVVSQLVQQGQIEDF